MTLLVKVSYQIGPTVNLSKTSLHLSNYHIALGKLCDEHITFLP